MRRLIRDQRWSLIAIYLVLVAISVFGLVRAESAYRSAHKLAIANRHRIIDIQHSRLYSCEQTYLALRQILFISLDGKKLTYPQKRKFSELLAIADPHRCVTQVAPNK